MSKKKEIISSYKKKIDLLKKYNKLYFSKDNPEISDGEYDDLKRTIIDLENKNSFLKDLNLLSGFVGFPPSNKFKKIKHLKPMLSLSNAFNENDMKDFLSKINNFLNNKNLVIELSSEPKIDGISASLIYEQGLLIKGISKEGLVIGEKRLVN